MTESFTAQTFAPHQGETFHVDVGAGLIIELRLSEVAEIDHRYHGGPRGAPFSLVFHGPGDSRLTQRTYQVEHVDLGRFPLFLVPIEPDSDGPRYEAVFN